MATTERVIVLICILVLVLLVIWQHRFIGKNEIEIMELTQAVARIEMKLENTRYALSYCEAFKPLKK